MNVVADTEEASSWLNNIGLPFREEDLTDRPNLGPS